MIIPRMTDGEFADWLRSMPRELPPGSEPQTGPWTGNEIVRHEYGESRQQ